MEQNEQPKDAALQYWAQELKGVGAEIVAMPGISVAMRPLNGGKQAVFTFPNGYSASVIWDSPFIFGGGYELAVMNSKGKLDYSTPVTSDVERGDAKRMDELLAQVAALPKEP